MFARVADLEAADFAALHAEAVAAGAGAMLDLERESSGCAKEFVMSALEPLIRLYEIALLVDHVGPDGADAHRALANASACLLRLIDRALVAHGRDHGHQIDGWRRRAWCLAEIAVHDRRDDPDRRSFGGLVGEIAGALSASLVALGRDNRSALPLDLIDALGLLLVVYTAAAHPAGSCSTGLA